MSGREYSRWLIFFQEHPTLDTMINYGCANVAAAIANSNSKHRYHLKDFLLEFKGHPRRHDSKELETKFRAFAEIHNRHLQKRQEK